MTLLWIIGNGGHAKVAIDTLRATGIHTLAGIVSDDSAMTPVIPNVMHTGPVSRETMQQQGIRQAFIAIGTNATRARIATELGPDVEWIPLIHPSAIVSPAAMIGSGVLLAAGSIVQTSTHIGEHAIINTAASIDHDCDIGKYTHIAPGVHIAGGVTVGEQTLVGIGSSVIPGINIGKHVTIGAGSVIIRDVPDGAKVAGNPATPIR